MTDFEKTAQELIEELLNEIQNETESLSDDIGDTPLPEEAMPIFAENAEAAEKERQNEEALSDVEEESPKENINDAQPVEVSADFSEIKTDYIPSDEAEEVLGESAEKDGDTQNREKTVYDIYDEETSDVLENDGEIPEDISSVSEQERDLQKDEYSEGRRKLVESFEIRENVEKSRLGGFNPDIDDYESINDAQEVQSELRARLAFSKTGLTVTAFITAVCAAVMYLPAVKELTESFSPFVNAAVCAVLLAGLIAVNFPAFAGGLSALFRFRADIDSPLAFTGLSAAVSYVIFLLFPNKYELSVFPAAAALFGLAVLMNGLGKYMLLHRIDDNFHLVANDKEKYAVNLVSGEDCERLTNGKVSEGPIACRKKTKNLLGFLNNSFSDDPVSRIYKFLTYIIIALSAVITALGVFYGKIALNAADIAAAFVYVMLLVTPFSSVLSAVVPLSRTAKKLRKKRILINGFSSVEKFSKTKALALTDAELFPNGTVQLISFDAEENQDINRVLVLSAALMRQSNSILSPVFEGIIAGHTGEMPSVDSILYEEGMGYVGLVDGEPVLVGNAKLMDKYKITGYNSLPTGKINRCRLYISVGKKLSAQFVIRYLPDRTIAKEIGLLADYGKTVCISTNDQNITKQLVSRLFRLDESCVEVMTGENHRLLCELEKYEESFDGSVAFFGKTDDFMGALTTCMRLGSCYTVTKVIQLFIILIGAAAGALTVFMNLGCSALTVILFQLISSAVSIGLPMLISRD